MREVAGCLVITTVQAPTEQVRRLAGLCRRWRLIAIGDEKTPRDWAVDGFEYLSLAEQLELGSRYAKLAPIGHYARKNIGYLLAVRDGAPIIAETDDDNAPLTGFLEGLSEQVTGSVYEDSGWVNVYALSGVPAAWPRGFPLTRIRENTAPAPALKESVRCPVQQYLVNGDADYDAIYRLTLGAEARFDDVAFALGRGSWSPFNSQATVWWPVAFPLMYLPATVTFRATDIIRSYVAQVCLHAAGMAVGFIGPGMLQERNPHDLMKDFEGELPVYLEGERLLDGVRRLDLPRAPHQMADSVRCCYRELVRSGYVEQGELVLLEAWLHDIRDAVSG
jgi:hypothetical protein